MNEQLTISREARVWRIDPKTRRRGHQGVANAREVLRRSRSSSGTKGASKASRPSTSRRIPSAA